MKKVLLFLSILIICLTYFKEDSAMTVFNDNYDYFAIYKLELDDNVVSNNNILSLFEDIDIKSISPYINKIYSDKLVFKQYSFNLFSKKNNIEKFTNYYINLLEEKGYKNEALKARTNGIYIKNMIVYCSNKQIDSLKRKINFQFEEI